MLIVKRSKPTANFLIIPNGALFDERLSYAARGILHELLGRPPGWQANADSLWRNARRHRGSKAEGRRAIREAFTELEEAGYMVRTRSRVPKGQRSGGDFVTVLTLYDTPQNEPHGDTGSGTPTRGASIREALTTVTPSVSTGTEDGYERRGEKDTSSLAFARSARPASPRESGLIDMADWFEANRERTPWDWED